MSENYAERIAKAKRQLAEIEATEAAKRLESQRAIEAAEAAVDAVMNNITSAEKKAAPAPEPQAINSQALLRAEAAVAEFEAKNPGKVVEVAKDIAEFRSLIPDAPPAEQIARAKAVLEGVTPESLWQAFNDLDVVQRAMVVGFIGIVGAKEHPPWLENELQQSQGRPKAE